MASGTYDGFNGRCVYVFVSLVQIANAMDEWKIANTSFVYWKKIFKINK